MKVKKNNMNYKISVVEKTVSRNLLRCTGHYFSYRIPSMGNKTTQGRLCFSILNTTLSESAIKLDKGDCKEIAVFKIS